MPSKNCDKNDDFRHAPIIDTRALVQGKRTSGQAILDTGVILDMSSWGVVSRRYLEAGAT